MSALVEVGGDKVAVTEERAAFAGADEADIKKAMEAKLNTLAVAK